MDNLLLYGALVASLVILLVFLRFGEKAALVVGALFAAVLVYLKLKKGAKQEVENEVLKERVENDELRNEAERRAEAAADRVRTSPADELREHDPFERR